MSDLVGERSTLYLALSYRFPAPDGVLNLETVEASLRAPASFPSLEGQKPWELLWARRPIDDAALLPHLDEQTRRGELMRVFRLQGLGASLFDRTWRLSDADGKKSIDAVFSGPPLLYVFESGYAFVAFPVRPTAATLPALLDLRAAITRRGLQVLSEPSPFADGGADRWRLLCEARRFGGFTLREAVAALIPNLPSVPPPAGRQNPKTLAVLFTSAPLDDADAYRLRLAQHSGQDFEGALDEGATFTPSRREQCLFSSFGVTWVVQPEQVPFLQRFDEVFRDRYLYKWLLAEHQRLVLLWLSSRCAALAAHLGPTDFRKLRLEMLHHVARYHFNHLSDEERHDRFYRWLRDRLDLEGLLGEVKEEITEIDEYLEARRGETLNKILAFLTIVLTPAGLLIGIFQDKTLPPLGEAGLTRWGQLWDARFLSHPPLLLLVAVLAVGFAIFRVILRRLDRPSRERRALEASAASLPAHPPPSSGTPAPR